MARVYVVTAPARIRGIYPSWPECEAAVKGVSGARFQAVASRERAEAILRGETAALPAGLYGFVDGNHLGGVGVVLVEQTGEGATVREAIGMTVYQVFLGAGVAPLASETAIRDALAALRNVLAELGALHLLLRIVPEGASLTVVHDYEGVGAWMEGRWQARDAIVAAVVAAGRALIRERRLAVTFRHQRGHQSSWAAADDFAHFNARADALAREAVAGA
jgi:ribonuclease HI